MSTRERLDGTDDETAAVVGAQAVVGNARMHGMKALVMSLANSEMLLVEPGEGC